MKTDSKQPPRAVRLLRFRFIRGDPYMARAAKAAGILDRLPMLGNDDEFDSRIAIARAALADALYHAARRAHPWSKS